MTDNQAATPPRDRRPPPRVAFLLPGYGVERRGAERLIEDLLRHLAGRCHATVFCRAASGPGVVHLRVPRRDHPLTLALDRLPVVGHGLRFLRLRPLTLELMGAAFAVLPRLLRHPPEIFVPEGGFWGGFAGAFLRRLRGVPFIDIGHGAPSRSERAAARWRPDRYVATTRYSEARMREAVPGLRTTVIPVGVEMARFAAAEPDPEVSALPRPRFLCPAALEPLKRVEQSVRAVARLPRGSLVVAGAGPERDAIERLGAERLGSGRFLLRSVAPEAMPALYAAADVVTQASASEAFGVVYLEAMAANRPVVTQRDPVREEVVGEAGLLCEVDHLDAYAAALAEAAARDWGDIPRGRARAFDWPPLADRYAALFAELQRRRS